MGCGSSSLKGDAPQGLNNSNTNNNDDDGIDNRPIRKVATNFTTVDYEQENNQERRHTEYAPHETERTPSATSDAIRHANNGITPKDEGPKDEDEKLKPYKSIDASNNAFTGGDNNNNNNGEQQQVKPYQSIDAGNTPAAAAAAAADPTLAMAN